MTIEEKSNLFKDAIASFIADVESLYTAHNFALYFLMISVEDSEGKTGQLLQALKEKYSDSTTAYQSDPESAEIVVYFYQSAKISERAKEITSRSMLVNMVSQFDAYLSKLIKAMFVCDPRRLNASQKKFSYADMLKFSSIDDARESLIEEEIESQLRNSHSQQLDWLGKKVDTTFRSNEKLWADFIEITERRNLYVHNDGVVNNNYLKNCKANYVKFSQPLKAKQPIHIDLEYIQHAYSCVMEVAIKVGQIMWRRLLPDSISESNEGLERICDSLIGDEEYELAVKILDFALKDCAKDLDEQRRLNHIIDKAQAYKWLKDEAKCKATLGEIEWKVLANIYQLAYYVLIEDFQSAANTMARVDLTDISRSAYRSWTLFKDFRQSNEFKRSYLKKFGEEYSAVEREPSFYRLARSFFKKKVEQGELDSEE